MVNKLKNVNFMNGYQFDTVEEVNQDELYAVNIENDATFKSFVSGMGLPSSKYVSLTFGASGSKYTAPVNGYVTFTKRSSAAGQYAYITSQGCGMEVYSSATNQQIVLTIPVQKGKEFLVQYTLAGNDTGYLRFFYAQGENN